MGKSLLVGDGDGEGRKALEARELATRVVGRAWTNANRSVDGRTPRLLAHARAGFATSARYSASTLLRIAMSDSNDSGASGPNEKRKKDA